MTTPTDKATDIKERLGKATMQFDNRDEMCLVLVDARDRIAALEAERIPLLENYDKSVKLVERQNDHVTTLKAERDALAAEVERLTEVNRQQRAALDALPRVDRRCPLSHSEARLVCIGEDRYIVPLEIYAEVERLREVVGKLLWRGGRLHAALTNDDWYSDAVLDEWGDAFTEAVEAARGTA